MDFDKSCLLPAGDEFGRGLEAISSPKKPFLSSFKAAFVGVFGWLASAFGWTTSKLFAMILGSSS
jgi:hypothetical protein